MVGIVTPVALIGEDVDDVKFILPLIIETTDGCLIKDADDDVEVIRQVGEIVDEDDDDVGPVTGVLIIWNVGGTAAATGPPTPDDAAVAATLVVVNICCVIIII